MRKKDKKTLTVESFIATLSAPPIIPGERSEDYDELSLRTTTALKPGDPIDDFIVDGIVRDTWDIIRYHRLKNALLNRTAHEALERIILPLIINQGAPFSNSTDRGLYAVGNEWLAEELSRGWRAQDVKSRKAVCELLTGARISLDEVMAEALSMKISEIVAFDSLIETAQGRRYAALEDLDRRHSALAQKVRRVTDDLEATEVKVLDIDPTAPDDAKQRRSSSNPGRKEDKAA